MSQNASLNRATCGRCHKCLEGQTMKVGSFEWPLTGMMMVVCETCGNKRCPHATDCALACTNSNEPGQKGSVWENYKVPT